MWNRGAGALDPDQRAAGPGSRGRPLAGVSRRGQARRGRPPDRGCDGQRYRDPRPDRRVRPRRLGVGAQLHAATPRGTGSGRVGLAAGVGRCVGRASPGRSYQDPPAAVNRPANTPSGPTRSSRGRRSPQERATTPPCAPSATAGWRSSGTASSRECGLPNPPAHWGWGKKASLLVGALAHSGRWRGVLAESTDQPHLIDASPGSACGSATNSSTSRTAATPTATPSASPQADPAHLATTTPLISADVDPRRARPKPELVISETGIRTRRCCRRRMCRRARR